MKEMTLEEFGRKFGRRLVQLREQFKLTQAELAARIGFKDKQAISRFETRGGNPTAETLLALAAAFDLTLSEFLDFSKLPDSEG